MTQENISSGLKIREYTVAHLVGGNDTNIIPCIHHGVNESMVCCITNVHFKYMQQSFIFRVIQYHTLTSRESKKSRSDLNKKQVYHGRPEN